MKNSTQEARGILEENRKVFLGRRFFTLPTLLSFGIAFGFIILLATRFDLDWSATWGNIRYSNPWLYLLAFFSYYLSFYFRGIRWRWMARNARIHLSPDGKLPSSLHCSQLILIGWFANAITWFRLGDAYRAYIFAQDARGSFSRTLGTILAERVLDMTAVFVLMAAGIVFVLFSGGASPSPLFVAIASVMLLTLGALLIAMRFYGARLAGLLPPLLQRNYTRFHEGTMSSFEHSLPLLFILGLIGWFLEIARLFLVIQALGMSISLPLIVFVALANALLTTIPITPGGLGVVEPGIMGLLMLRLARPDALSVALLDRSISYASIIVFGGILLLLRHMMAARRGQPSASPPVIDVPRGKTR
ncbi:MAG: flippase-like domain-containing protein [Chloroflexi bacterium]|nr:flippase-like domain-containing protein [Chloroflexota bacterium]